ncbi:MAG: hypothetical protein KC417_07750, partial [Myxococcales bacterium]|nr:hypothetical protein [Myxococcales bacterium]
DGDRVGDVGYSAEGSIDRRSLVDCVRKLLEADGSGVRRVDVDGHPGVAGMSGDSRAIFFGKRAVVGGTEALVRSVLDAVAHADHAAAGATDLEALRAVVTPESDVVVLLRVPERWRKVVRTGAVLRFGVGFADLGAMELVGLALAFHDGLSLRMRAGFANDGQAKSLAEAARRGMDLVRKSDAVAVSVAAPVLARTRVSAEGRFVTLETAADASEIEPLLRLVQKGMAPAPPVDAAGGADRNASEPSNPR